MDEPNMASAIEVPEPPRSPSVNGLKRGQSEMSEHEEDSKRQRRSSGKNSPTITAQEKPASADGPESSDPKPAEGADDEGETRRKSKPIDEKGRSKRLFGALLGNLNQPGDRTSKRRQEIEQRRKAELQRQDERNAQDNQRMQERLAEQQREIQLRVDEGNMRLRHRHLLETANYLLTTAEPRVYYRPWDLRPDEEDRIDDQIRDARAQIEKELRKFAQCRARNDDPREESDGAAQQLATNRDEEDKEGAKDRDTDLHEAEAEGMDADAPAKSANNESNPPTEELQSIRVDPATNETSALNVTPRNTGEETPEGMEDDGDHVVEGDEDTVIY